MRGLKQRGVILALSFLVGLLAFSSQSYGNTQYDKNCNTEATRQSEELTLTTYVDSITPTGLSKNGISNNLEVLLSYKATSKDSAKPGIAFNFKAPDPKLGIKVLAISNNQKNLQQHEITASKDVLPATTNAKGMIYAKISVESLGGLKPFPVTVPPQCASTESPKLIVDATQLSSLAAFSERVKTIPDWNKEDTSELVIKLIDSLEDKADADEIFSKAAAFTSDEAIKGLGLILKIGSSHKAVSLMISIEGKKLNERLALLKNISISSNFEKIPDSVVDSVVVAVKPTVNLTDAWIKKALSNAKLKAGQWMLSKPRVEEYSNRLLWGERPPPIDVNNETIVDGHHRYVAGKVVGILPAISLSDKVPDLKMEWKDVLIDSAVWID